MQQFVHKLMMLKDGLLRANAMIVDINLTKGKALVAEVRRSIGNQNLYFLYLNVSDWQSQVDLFQAAAKLSTHESIDAIVTNTEVDKNNSTFESPLDNLGILEELPCIHLKALEVNLIEVIYTAHLALHYLPKSSESEKIYQPPTNTEGQDSPNRDRHIFLMGSMLLSKEFFINLLMPYLTDTPILSTFGRAILARVPLCKIEAVVDAGTRLMASKIVSGTLNGAKSGRIWEVYGQDFDDVDREVQQLG
ncbi:hypothetical protein BGAL_0132g00060 [Botrytis galanthina]|uniref:Uncharacterized protein n=1 Tax=Botrytis galanthina TaxID=278940 RepID=A0A4S8RBU3_9HELO|nr:hypothetical protein BGAL_0132g00060 [Botrytis galanthina]